MDDDLGGVFSSTVYPNVGSTYIFGGITIIGVYGLLLLWSYTHQISKKRSQVEVEMYDYTMIPDECPTADEDATEFNGYISDIDEEYGTTLLLPTEMPVLTSETLL